MPSVSPAYDAHLGEGGAGKEGEEGSADGGHPVGANEHGTVAVPSAHPSTRCTAPVAVEYDHTACPIEKKLVC